MHIDHDIPNKIISVSQPGYIDTILENFSIGQISRKSHCQKVPFSSGDLVDDNPIPLTKHDQSLYMHIIRSLLSLLTQFRFTSIFCIYL